ncbi:MAG: choline/ethanolamine kinase family protein [Slackia sp.]|nr:choline/ethanolamine kinase family protein [Slackia sp.]
MPLSFDDSVSADIAAVLSCDPGDIEHIVSIDEGLTNRSFRFDCRGETYVYRSPGAGTDKIIDRASETFSQSVAKKLDIDGTFIYEDPEKGWKISRFIHGCVEFDYHDERHVRRALALARRLHRSGETSRWTFDVYKKAEEIRALLDARSFALPDGFSALEKRIARLYRHVCSDAVAPCLCHNDFYAPNFLVKDDEMHLIDWEYSAMSDYASDLGTFICCSDYDVADAERAIALYFDRKPTAQEKRHCLAYVGISSYYWYVWALYKEACGDAVGAWLDLWRRYADDFGAYALALYEKE